MNRIILITVFTLFIGWFGKAQSETNTEHHTYYYSVTNVTSEEQLQEVYDLFEDLKFVTKVKLNFKPEKADRAQFIIYITEPKRTSESQKMFEPIELKKIIIDHNLLPSDLKIEDH